MPYHSIEMLLDKNFDKIEELYIHSALRIFGLSLIGIFFPLYLLSLGYSLSTLFLLYLIVHITHAGSVMITAKLCCRYGCKHIMVLGLFILAIFLLLLMTLHIYSWPFWLLGFFLGLQNAVYWFAYHGFFAQNTTEKHEGEEVGLALIVLRLAAAIGPMLGGIFLAFFDFHALVLISILFLFISVVPLIFSQDKRNINYCAYTKIFTKRKFNDFIAPLGFAVDLSITNVIWPIIIYTTIISNYTAIGMINSLTLFISITLMFTLGHWADKNRPLVLWFGAIGTSLVWIGRLFAKLTSHVIFIDFGYGLTQTATQINYE